MFNFNNRKSKKNKVMLWIIIGLLCVCMVLPSAFALVSVIVNSVAK